MYLNRATGKSGDKLFAEIAMSEEGANIGFLLYADDADGKPKLYLVNLHG